MKTEQRFYLLNTDDFFSTNLANIPDDEFMTLAEQDGQIYSLQEFVEAFNSESINTDYQCLRVINVNLDYNIQGL